MLIYIAGPYSAETSTDIEVNVRRAASVGQQLMRRGHSVICPHTMTHKWDEDTGLCYRDFIRQCLDLIKRCDAIYLLPGWENSVGSRIEFNWAIKRGIHPYYKLDEVPEADQVTTENEQRRFVGHREVLSHCTIEDLRATVLSLPDNVKLAITEDTAWSDPCVGPKFGELYT